MHLKKKQKWALSLALILAMLFSMIGTAAAKSTERDAQPVITANAESEPTHVVTVKEKEEELESEAEEETEEKTEAESEKETKEEPESGPEEETKADTESESEKETEADTESESEKETETEPESEEEKKTKEEIESEEEETKEEMDSGSEEAFEEEQREDLNQETSSAPENTGEKLPEVFIPDVHKHSWSKDWAYDQDHHWHECDAEGCPGIDDGEKDGYGEHEYDENGVCTGCGYDAMDGIAVVAEGDVPAYQEAYEAMIALKDEYPEGMTWTNYEPYGSKGDLGSAYTWNGGAIYGAKSAVGCMAFAFILSDAAFDHLPARAVERGKFTFEDVKVGDILRVRGNSHSVIVLQKSAGGVIVAEGNYNKSVHWGRSMSAAEVKNADFMITRYPKDYVPSDDPEADEVADSGTAGSLSWSLTNGGVLTISGRGAIPNYTPNGSPWSGHEFYTVIIEDGVTGIGDYAFYQSETLLSVYIADSVEAIGQSAFRDSSLMAATIPGSVKTIGANAFYGCERLTSVTVSEGVTTIGAEAFRNCVALAYIDFPASIRTVGDGAFMSCHEMVSVRFMPGSSKVALGDNLFSRCMRLNHVTLPQTADCISAGMFASCTLLPVLYIPASVQNIGENPFASCGNLGVIYFGGSEAEWNAMTPVYLRTFLENNGTKVVFDAAFDDPFITDPDDPGDFLPGGEEPCTNHLDADKDGKCDNCGAVMSAGNPEPDDGEKGPDGSGGNHPPANDSSSGGSGSSGGINRPNRGDSPSVSTTIRQGADGSKMITKTHRDGTVVTMSTDFTGKVTIEAKLSGLRIDTAQQGGKAVSLPISAVSVGRDVSMAPHITICTERDQLVKVAVPVLAPPAGTVAMLVNADGSLKVISGSVPAGNNIVAYLPDGATIKIVDNSRSFSDVPAGIWFEEAVSFVSARDLFYGTTETAFAPGALMTYAMTVTALARFDGVQTDGGTTWYEKSVEWAAARGIWDGTTPDSNLTYEKLVTMLWKYQGSPVEADALSGYGEIGSLSDTQKAVGWAMKYGIISGFSDGALNLQQQVNRAQAAQIIMNVAKQAAMHSLP